MAQQHATRAGVNAAPPNQPTASQYNQQQQQSNQYAQPQQLNRTAQSQAGSPPAQASPRQIPPPNPGQQLDPNRAPTPSQQQQRWNQMSPPSTTRAGSPDQDLKGKGRQNEPAFESRNGPLSSAGYDGRNQPMASTSSPVPPFSHLPPSSKLPISSSPRPPNSFDAAPTTSQAAYNVELARQQQAHLQQVLQNGASKRAREPVPVAPTIPTERKRNKIEYVPLSTKVERHGGRDLRHTESTIAQAIESRRPRHSDDLG